MAVIEQAIHFQCEELSSLNIFRRSASSKAKLPITPTSIAMISNRRFYFQKKLQSREVGILIMC
jgi:hypothetical protein